MGVGCGYVIDSKIPGQQDTRKVRGVLYIQRGIAKEDCIWGISSAPGLAATTHTSIYLTMSHMAYSHKFYI
jgi:hypothetical protein